MNKYNIFPEKYPWPVLDMRYRLSREAEAVFDSGSLRYPMDWPVRDTLADDFQTTIDPIITDARVRET